MQSFHSTLQQAFGVKNDELDRISSFFKPFNVAKGHFLTKKDKHCRGLYFVNTGFVRYFNIQNHKEVTQWISGPNYFATEISSFLFKMKSRWNIQALSDVSGIMIDSENYTKLKIEFKNWDSLEKQFIAHCFINLENRVNQLISLNSEERELLVDVRRRHTITCLPTRARKGSTVALEDLRCAMLGDSFICACIAFVLQHALMLDGPVPELQAVAEMRAT